MYKFTYRYLSIYISACLHTEREREIERQRQRKRNRNIVRRMERKRDKIVLERPSNIRI